MTKRIAKPVAERTCKPRKKKREYPEGDLHQILVKLLRSIPGLMFFHPPNEAIRNPHQAAVMYYFGVESGIPDFFIFGVVGKHLTPLCIELKAPGKKATPKQLAWLHSLDALGWKTAIYDTYEDFENCLIEHGYTEAKGIS